MAKEVRIYGRNTEELKKLDDKEFMKLVPSRVRRSFERSKNVKEHAPLRKKIDDALSGKRKKPIKTHCRDFVITPKMIGMVIKVYNGKEYTDVTIIEQMFGHYLGEFSYTRRHGAHSGPGIGATKSSRSAKK